MNKITRPIDQSCQICGKQAPAVDLMMAHLVRPVVVNVIKRSYPEWSEDGLICADDLNRFRVRAFDCRGREG
jgi:hypothetical protein